MPGFIKPGILPSTMPKVLKFISENFVFVKQIASSGGNNVKGRKAIKIP
jgi:hypothetical protein